MIMDSWCFLWTETLVSWPIRIDAGVQAGVEYPVPAVVLLDGEELVAFRVLTLIVPAEITCRSVK